MSIAFVGFVSKKRWGNAMNLKIAKNLTHTSAPTVSVTLELVHGVHVVSYESRHWCVHVIHSDLIFGHFELA